MSARIFIAGGYGLVGSSFARLTRHLYQDVELILAGRTPAQGEALARELGAARTAILDIDDPASFGALAESDLVVAALYDPTNALLEAALARGIAHIGITTKADDVAPVTFSLLRTPPKRPVVLAGYCAAGVVTLVAKNEAKQFRRIDRVAATALFDLRDQVGPMTANDAEHLMERALLRERGRWTWTAGAQHPRRVTIGGAQTVDAYPTGLLDVPGLAALTDAADVRFDLAQGDSLGTLSGGAASSDAYVEIEGVLASGRPGTQRVTISDPRGVMHLTALGVLVAAERVLGLDGSPAPAGGLYVPETLIAPGAAIARLRDFGVRISTSARAV